MKKIISSISLLFLCVTQFHIGAVYAENQSVLESEKQKGIQTLDIVEQIVDIAVGKLDTKIRTEEKKDQLQEKNEEIKEYLAEVSADIQGEKSQSDIKQKVEQAKKVVVLKVVSGVTEYESAADNIRNDVANTPEQKKDALDSIQDSLETVSGDYSIIIRSKLSISKVEKLFELFDTNTQIDLLYESEGKKYFEVFLEEDSIFRQEMLEDIASGILPETFMGVEIVLPEVYGVSEVSLQGEDLSQTWGIQQYQSYRYFDTISERSKKIRVGVVDTGIDYTHPDLKQNVNQALGKDFVNEDDDAYDDQGHGTHVAGTIAANINGSGIIGVNPYVELVPLKICTDKGFCPSYAVIRALEYAKEQKIDILNMSLGGRGNPVGHPICAGIASVVDAGGIVVAASGNSNIDTSRFVPGGCQQALTVAAVNSAGMRAPFSNYGAKVDVAAPGVGVYSTYPINKGSYKQLSGTSMATPHVVGLISLIQSYQPDITAAGVKTLFQKYNSEVQSDSVHKPIAAGVAVEALIAGFAPVIEEVEIVEELQEETNTGSVSLYVDKPGFESIEGGLGDTTLPEIGEEELMIEEVPELSDMLHVLDFDLGVEEGLEINSLSGTTVEESINEQVTQENFYISSGDKSFNEGGKLLDGNTEINTSEEELLGEVGVVEGDFDIFNIPKLSEEEQAQYQEGGVEINSAGDEIDLQEFFIDGAEKGVKINSAQEEKGEELELGAAVISEEIFYDEDGNPIDFSEMEEVEIIQDELDFSMDEEVHIDGAEPPVEINSSETSPEELIEIPEIPADLQAENLEEGIPENESFKSIQTETEIIETIEETEEVFIDGAENGGVEINSAESSEAEEVELEEFSQNLVEEKELDVGEIPTPEDFQDETDDIGEDEIIEGRYEVYREGSEELEEEGSMGIQNTYSCEIFPGQSCSFRIYKSYRYQFIKENPSVSTHTSSKRTLYIYGENPGTATYKLYMYGRHYHTIYVTVKEVPKPQEFDIYLTAGQSTNLYFPDTTSQNYRYSAEYFDGGSASLQTYRRSVEIRSYKAGKVDFYIRGNEGILKYIVHTHILPPPPPVYETSVYEGKNITIKGDSSYEITSSVEGLVDIYAGNTSMRVTGKLVGEVELYFKKGGIHEFTHKITILETPKPQEYDIKVLEGEYSYLYFPREYYRIYMQKGSSGSSNMYLSSNGMIRVQGKLEGQQVYHVYDGYGFHRYTLNIKVTIKEPIVKNISVYEGNHISLGYCRYSNLYGQSDNITRYYKYGRYCYAQALKTGDTQILMKTTSPYEDNYLFNITVKEIPVPKEYDVSLTLGGDANIYLPEEIEQYQISYEGDNILNTSQRFEKHMYIKTERVGTGKIILKNQDGYVVYIIHIASKPHYRAYTIYLSDRYYNNSHSNYSYRSQNNNISYQSGDYLLGNSIGETEIHVFNSYGLREIWTVTVLPKPNPIEINCEINVGEQCYFNGMRRTGQYLYESNPGMLYINWFRSSIKVAGEASGTAKIYIRSPYGDYISHILKVTIHPVPPRLKTLTMMLGSEAETSRYFTSGKYSYKVSKAGMLALSRISNTYVSAREGLKLTGLSAGEVDLYVYELGDHTTTYRITILPTSPMTFPQAEIRVGEGKEKRVQVQGGYAPYKVIGYNERYTNVDVVKNTGELKIEGVKQSLTYATLEDKYGQRVKIKILVEETRIETDVTELTLAPGETKYISVTNYVGAIRQVFRSNNNIRVFSESFIENGERIYKIRIQALYSGTSRNIFQDYKQPYNNYHGTAITITGDLKNPDYKEFIHPDAVDPCPNGDYSGSSNDGKCGKAPVEEEESESGNDNSNNEEGISDSELDALLQELFEEFGIQNVESEGVEVNTSFNLTQEHKNHIDTVVKKWIQTRGDNFVLQMQTAIPALKQKYTRYEYQVIFDYLSDSIDKQINLKITHSAQNISIGEVGGLEFQVQPNLQGKISTIGVQYTDGNSNTQKQELKLQSDGKYIVAFSQDSCSGCKDLRPYYLISGKTDTMIASVGEEIEVANSSYSQFVNILKSIWNWRGYNKKDSINALVDIKEDYDDYASLAVSLFPGVGEVYDVGTLVLGKDPITGEELGSLSKAFTIIGLLSGLGSGKAAREAGDVLLKDLANELNLSSKEVESIATELIKDININSVDDLVKFRKKLRFTAISSKIKSLVYVSRYTSVNSNNEITTSFKSLSLISEIKFVRDDSLIIKKVFKGNGEGFFMSDLVVSQMKYVGKNPSKLNNILLENVINKEVREALEQHGEQFVIDNWGTFKGIDSMSTYIVEELGKNIESIRIFKEFDIYDIQLILK